MTDRKLLELAAKAAGIEVTAVVADGIPHRFGGGYWNPLTDDGDALRLACDLFLTVEIWSGSSKHKQGVTLVESDEVVIEEPHNGDANTATRRAIVRAAAGIGKQMEENT